MKKCLLLLAVLLAISAAGCNNGSTGESSDTTIPVTAMATTQATTQAATQATEKKTEPLTEAEHTTEAIETEPATDSVVTEPEAESEQLLKIEVNGNTLYADFEDNSSAEALKEKLQSGSLTLEMEDYGGFEKVGDLPFSLPTNDENITTSAGDVILYQGNKLTIYYDTNTWTFTKVAKIRNADSSLKSKLGEGNVKVTLSIIEKQEETL